MQSIDISNIVQLGVQLLVAVLALAIPFLVNKLLQLAQAHLGLKVDATQAAVLAAAEQNAVGMLQHALTSGSVQLDKLNVGSPQVAQAVLYLNQTVPQAMAYFGLTPELMAQKLMGKLGVSLAADPTVPTIKPTM